MSTLELDILATESVMDRVQPARCTFTRSGDASTLASAALKFTQTERVYDGPLSKIYRGTLTDDHGMCEQVICKLVQLTYAGGDPATVKHEAGIYTTYLSQAQGICVPKFYGLFEGIILRDIAACIILEDCGVPVTQQKLDVDIPLRGKVYRALMTLHKLGVVHNDFTIGNILVDSMETPTRVNVIDFELTKPHECRFRMKFHAFTLTTNFRRCRELQDIANGLKLVTPYAIPCMGMSFRLDSFQTLEELAQQLPGRPYWSEEDLLAQAQKALDKYYDTWGDKEAYITRKKKWSLKPLV